MRGIGERELPERRLQILGLLILFAFSLATNLYGTSSRTLNDDEGAYASIALRIVEDGRWLPLVSANNIYLAKPPLIAWPIAASFSVFGIGELTARLPSALFGALVVASSFLIAARMFGAGWALLAAFLIATCMPWLTTHGARSATGDTFLSLLIIAAIWLYVRAIEISSKSGLWLAAATLAVSAMIKGPYPILIVPATAFIWTVGRIFVESDFSAGAADVPLSRENPIGPSMDRAPFPVLLLLGVGSLPYLLWIASNNLAYPGYLDGLYEETFVRLTKGLDPSHVGNIWTYPRTLYDAFGPWLLLLIPALVSLFRQHDADERNRELAIWALLAAVTIGICTISVSKHSWYIFPSLAPIAILIAFGAKKLADSLVHSWTRQAIIALLFAGAVVNLAQLGGILSHAPEADAIRLLQHAVASLPEAEIYASEESCDHFRSQRFFYVQRLGVKCVPSAHASRIISAAATGSRCRAFIFSFDDRASIEPAPTAPPTLRADLEFEDMVDRPYKAGLMDLCDGRISEAVASARRALIPSYQATLEDGIDFTRDGLPTFVTAIDGLSRVEKFGRWSDDDKIVIDLAEPLPEAFDVAIIALGFGPNIGKPVTIRAGGQARQFVVRQAASQFHVSFDGVQPVTRLVIDVPAPTSPRELGMSSDSRRLGLALVRLAIISRR